MDFSQGPSRWLTLASAEESDGAGLQLDRNDNLAAKASQQARLQQGQPAAMFFTDDIQRDYERMKAAGAEFMMAPTKVTGSTIATVNDQIDAVTRLDDLGCTCSRSTCQMRRNALALCSDTGSRLVR